MKGGRLVAGTLALAAVISMANACVPALPHVRDRLVAHAQVESGLNPLAIHDNQTSASYKPASAYEAWQITTMLVAHGHSVDAGIAQVNSRNWPRLGLTPAGLFNAKTNLCAGAVILIQDYEAACRYNTGKPYCENGYPQAVDYAQRMIGGTAGVSPEPASLAPGATAEPATSSPANALDAPMQRRNSTGQILMFNGWNGE